MKCTVIWVLVIASLGPAVSAVPTSTSNNNVESSVSCPEGAEGIGCLGSSIANNVVKQVLGVTVDNVSSRQLFDGIELIQLNNNNSSSLDDETETKGRDISTSLLHSLRKLVSSYEIRVHLSELISAAINEVSDIQARKGDGFGGGGFGGGKKKGGGLMMVMMMMGGMMKAMALGALGLLAMKALTVSSLAFLLSAVVGLKKLVSKKDDDDGGHYVQVVGGHGHGHGGSDYHHRRSFEAASEDAQQLAYRGQQRK